MPPQRDISNLFFLYAIVFYHQRQTNIDFLCVSFIISSCRHYIETNTLLHFITVIIKNTSSPKKKKKNLCCMIRSARLNSKFCLQVHALQ